MNHILIAGHLGADPEVRFTSSGQKVTTFRVACNSRRSGKDETVWWKVTVWGDQFDKMISFFKKGSPIMVAGELTKPEIFNDREGRPQISLNIVASSLMFSPFGGKGDSNSKGGEEAPVRQEAFAQAGFGGMSDFGGSQRGQKDHQEFSDEEIPF